MHCMDPLQRALRLADSAMVMPGVPWRRGRGTPRGGGRAGVA